MSGEATPAAAAPSATIAAPPTNPGTEGLRLGPVHIPAWLLADTVKSLGVSGLLALSLVFWMTEHVMPELQSLHVGMATSNATAAAHGQQLSSLAARVDGLSSDMREMQVDVSVLRAKSEDRGK